MLISLYCKNFPLWPLVQLKQKPCVVRARKCGGKAGHLGITSKKCNKQWQLMAFWALGMDLALIYSLGFAFVCLLFNKMLICPLMYFNRCAVRKLKLKWEVTSWLSFYVYVRSVHYCTGSSGKAIYFYCLFYLDSHMELRQITSPNP